jgi:hypothetical protein
MRVRSFNPISHCADVSASEGEDEETQEVEEVEEKRVVG